MLRIMLFLGTNIAVLAVVAIVFQVLGLESILAENGVDLDLSALLVFSAVVGFSGNQLPETNRTVALTRLSVHRGGGEIALGEVPAGLLSECWNDMRLIAAEGSGFDPAWQSKVEG